LQKSCRKYDADPGVSWRTAECGNDVSCHSGMYQVSEGKIARLTDRQQGRQPVFFGCLPFPFPHENHFPCRPLPLRTTFLTNFFSCKRISFSQTTASEDCLPQHHSISINAAILVFSCPISACE